MKTTARRRRANYFHTNTRPTQSQENIMYTIKPNQEDVIPSHHLATQELVENFLADYLASGEHPTELVTEALEACVDLEEMLITVTDALQLFFKEAEVLPAEELEEFKRVFHFCTAPLIEQADLPDVVLDFLKGIVKGFMDELEANLVPTKAVH